MGYQPSIDSYEEWTGGDWSSRKQILAWSAGTEIIMRIKNTGPEVAKLWDAANIEDRDFYFDEYKHLASWFTWKIPESVEGRDDIVSLNIIRPYQKKTAHQDAESIAMGTASGELILLTVGMSAEKSLTTQKYETNGLGVRSTDISPSHSPLLAACISGSVLALYPVYSNASTEAIKPLSKVTAIAEDKQECTVRSTHFLCENRLAVGLGRSTEPIHVYEVNPSGLSKHPLRKFGLNARNWAPNDRAEGSKRQKISSIYPICPLPPDSQSCHAPGQTFLSGCFDGIIRLHDMRSPSAYESSYWDPTYDSSIYSLQTQGRERLIAGTARHSMLKVFDLRVSGGRAYHHIDVPCPKSSVRRQPPKAPAAGHSKQAWRSARYSWNIFLNPRNGHHARLRSTESPIYSLSLPSPHSASIFAGVENAIVQFDFVSMLDRHPDPIFAPALERSRHSEQIDVKRSWNPRKDVLNLGMFEQVPETGGMRLLVQAGIGQYRGSVEGLDERWTDPSTVRERERERERRR